MEANKAAFDLIVNRMAVSGIGEGDGGRDKTARIIDFDRLERNDFLVINQFRVDVP